MLFSEESSVLHLRSLSDVKEKLIAHLSQPGSLRRHTKAHEDYSLCAFLTTGIIACGWALPVTVTRRESPDFSLTIGTDDRIIGVEHTCATTEKYKMDEPIAESYPKGSVVELPYYSPTVHLPKKSRAAIKRPERPDLKLDHCGWGDYGMEKDCAWIVADAIRRKTEKLNDTHFVTFSSNELIVEDVSHVSVGKRLDKAVELLRERCASSPIKVDARFNKIHLITEHSLVYDVFNDGLRISLDKDDLLAMWKRFTK